MPGFFKMQDERQNAWLISYFTKVGARKSTWENPKVRFKVPFTITSKFRGSSVEEFNIVKSNKSGS